MEKPKILIAVDWFPPAYKAGGPIRSCENLVNVLKDVYEIFVLTGDTDFNDELPLEGIRTDVWVTSEGFKVCYLSKKKRSFVYIINKIKEVNPTFLYLNSMFSKSFTIYPLLGLRTGLFDSKVVLAPRGMLRNSALSFKKNKKIIFFSFLRWLGFVKIVYKYHATDPQENEDIANVLKIQKSKIDIIQN